MEFTAIPQIHNRPVHFRRAATGASRQGLSSTPVSTHTPRLRLTTPTSSSFSPGSASRRTTNPRPASPPREIPLQVPIPLPFSDKKQREVEDIEREEVMPVARSVTPTRTPHYSALFSPPESRGKHRGSSPHRRELTLRDDKDASPPQLGFQGSLRPADTSSSSRTSEEDENSEPCLSVVRPRLRHPEFIPHSPPDVRRALGALPHTLCVAIPTEDNPSQQRYRDAHSKEEELDEEVRPRQTPPSPTARSSPRREAAVLTCTESVQQHSFCGADLPQNLHRDENADTSLPSIVFCVSPVVRSSHLAITSDDADAAVAPTAQRLGGEGDEGNVFNISAADRSDNASSITEAEDDGEHAYDDCAPAAVDAYTDAALPECVVDPLPTRLQQPLEADNVEGGSSGAPSSPSSVRSPTAFNPNRSVDSSSVQQRPHDLGSSDDSSLDDEALIARVVTSSSHENNSSCHLPPVEPLLVRQPIKRLAREGSGTDSRLRSSATTMSGGSASPSPSLQPRGRGDEPAVDQIQMDAGNPDRGHNPSQCLTPDPNSRPLSPSDHIECHESQVPNSSIEQLYSCTPMRDVSPLMTVWANSVPSYGESLTAAANDARASGVTSVPVRNDSPPNVNKSDDERFFTPLSDKSSTHSSSSSSEAPHVFFPAGGNEEETTGALLSTATDLASVVQPASFHPPGATEDTHHNISVVSFTSDDSLEDPLAASDHDVTDGIEGCSLPQRCASRPTCVNIIAAYEEHLAATKEATIVASTVEDDMMGTSPEALVFDEEGSSFDGLDGSLRSSDVGSPFDDADQPKSSIFDDERERRGDAAATKRVEDVMRSLLMLSNTEPVSSLSPVPPLSVEDDGAEVEESRDGTALEVAPPPALCDSPTDERRHTQFTVQYTNKTPSNSRVVLPLPSQPPSVPSSDADLSLLSPESRTVDRGLLLLVSSPHNNNDDVSSSSMHSLVLSVLDTAEKASSLEGVEKRLVHNHDREWDRERASLFDYDSNAPRLQMLSESVRIDHECDDIEAAGLLSEDAKDEVDYQTDCCEGGVQPSDLERLDQMLDHSSPQEHEAVSLSFPCGLVPHSVNVLRILREGNTKQWAPGDPSALLLQPEAEENDDRDDDASDLSDDAKQRQRNEGYVPVSIPLSLLPCLDDRSHVSRELRPHQELRTAKSGRDQDDIDLVFGGHVVVAGALLPPGGLPVEDSTAIGITERKGDRSNVATVKDEGRDEGAPSCRVVAGESLPSASSCCAMVIPVDHLLDPATACSLPQVELPPTFPNFSRDSVVVDANEINQDWECTLRGNQRRGNTVDLTTAAAPDSVYLMLTSAPTQQNQSDVSTSSIPCGDIDDDLTTAKAKRMAKWKGLLGGVVVSGGNRSAGRWQSSDNIHPSGPEARVTMRQHFKAKQITSKKPSQLVTAAALSEDVEIPPAEVISNCVDDTQQQNEVSSRLSPLSPQLRHRTQPMLQQSSDLISLSHAIDGDGDAAPNSVGIADHSSAALDASVAPDAMLPRDAMLPCDVQPLECSGAREGRTMSEDPYDDNIPSVIVVTSHPATPDAIDANLSGESKAQEPVAEETLAAGVTQAVVSDGEALNNNKAITPTSPLIAPDQSPQLKAPPPRSRKPATSAILSPSITEDEIRALSCSHQSAFVPEDPLASLRKETRVKNIAAVLDALDRNRQQRDTTRLRVHPLAPPPGEPLQKEDVKHHSRFVKDVQQAVENLRRGEGSRK